MAGLLGVSSHVQPRGGSVDNRQGFAFNYKQIYEPDANIQSPPRDTQQRQNVKFD